jgi:3-isopropylmalate/(R)-2-methylmalate dehydratase small subunit
MSGLRFTGKVWMLGDNVDTDAILPARYLTLTDEKEQGLHLLENMRPNLAQKVSSGDILVAGENFGCGSSREHAPLAIRGSGIRCVVAASFARIFFRNAINIGLPVLAVPEATQLAEGHIVTVDCLTGAVLDEASGRLLQGAPLAGFLLEILHAGGLIGRLRQRATGENI